MDEKISLMIQENTHRISGGTVHIHEFRSASECESVMRIIEKLQGRHGLRYDIIRFYDRTWYGISRPMCHLRIRRDIKTEN